MFVPLVNESDGVLAVEIIKSSADQRKAAHREIVHVRSEIYFAVEPWLDGVLIGRRNIHQMCREQRAHVIVNDLIDSRAAARWAVRLEKQKGEKNPRKRGAGREDKPG